VPLTEYEARQIQAIEQHLRDSDRAKRTRIAAAATGLVATPLLVGGVAWHLPLLCIIGWLCIVGWVVLRCIDGW
jgi:hypothetical protein